MDLKEKKLLILGANAETIPIVQRAQEMGVIVVVTDNICNSPAKTVADEFFDIDGKDVLKIIALIKENKIDGVLLGVADPLMNPYVEICKALDLPCFLQGEVIEFFRNKNKFKNLCKKSGFKVPQEYFSCTSMEEIREQDIVYPIVVKPTLSRGGKGCSYCGNKLELEKAFEHAQHNSDNEEVLGEEYIDSEDVVATFIFHEGKARLLTLYDRVMLKSVDRLGTVTYEQIFPSKYTEQFVLQKQACFENMFDYLGINKGIVNLQMFVHNGEFVLYDPDGIINGGICNNISDTIYDVDLLGGFIKFALGEELTYGIGKRAERQKNLVASRIWILLKEGKINRIKGRDLLEMKDYVIDSLWRLSEGDNITKEIRYTEKATLARITVVASTIQELEKRVAEVRSILEVYDTFGNSMIDLRRM